MITINDKYLDRHISKDELNEIIKNEAKPAYEKVMKGTGGGAGIGLGWRDLPNKIDKNEVKRIQQTAAQIRANNDILVVLGIGGSYLGARAVIDSLQPENDSLKVLYAGIDLSSAYLTKIFQKLEGKHWSICVISKSGTTTEPAIALRIFRQKLAEKYGEEADRRVYAITDAQKGTLHDLAKSKNWPMFVVPDDIGGRYSVMSPVGLLPIATAGIDIEELLRGAADQSKDNNDSIKYAACRNLLDRKGFATEMLASFETRFVFVNEWWKQLFGESEGKNNQALWLSSVIYSTDLHSLGQFLQDGSRVNFETIVNIEKCSEKFIVPDTGEDDGVQYLAGKSLEFINNAAFRATVQAHHDGDNGGVPVIILNIPELTAYHIGSFLYFMMMSCAISAYILSPDGNPFNQPGVEIYKNNMFKLLGKK